MSNGLPDRLIFDILIDRIYNAIVEAQNEQVAIDPLVGFNVEKEKVTQISDSDVPLVVVYFSEERSNGIEAVRKHQGLNLTYSIELFATSQGTETETSDERSAKRLYYLAAQVKPALTRLINADFGFDMGIISDRPLPVFQRMKAPKLENDNENIISAGVFTLVIGASFDSEDYESLDLEEITVDAGLFKSANEY